MGNDPLKETKYFNDRRQLLPTEVLMQHKRGKSFSANLLKV